MIVSWLPLYHDMGLIGAWLGSFYYGIPLTILSPFTFLTRPNVGYGLFIIITALFLASPNFGYELCVNKIADESLAGLDLSSWRLALNGAEAVQLRPFADLRKNLPLIILIPKPCFRLWFGRIFRSLGFS